MQTIADTLELGCQVLSVVAGVVVVLMALRVAPTLRLSSHRVALGVFLAAAVVVLVAEGIGVYAAILSPSTLADVAEEFAELVAICAVGVGLVLINRAERREVLPLRRSANMDGLTGLANRSSFRRAALGRIEAAREGGTPLSCIMVDVDDFKSYNDDYGHVAGDRALRHVARVIEVSTRAEDLVARYGGEEFLIMVNADAGGALDLAERVRRGVEGEYGAGRDGYFERRVTVSVGVATLADGTRTLDQILRATDAAMYHSKRSGKNRVSSVEDPRAFVDSSDAR